MSTATSDPRLIPTDPSLAVDASSRLLRPVLAWVVFAIVVLVTVRGESPATFEPDIWWHLRVGEWVLENGTVTRTDPFSYPEGKPWVAYSWLFEVLIALLHRTFGPVGFVVYRAAMALLVVLAIDRLIRRVQPQSLAGTALLFGAVLALTPLFTERPWLFTILFTTLTLRVIIEFRDPRPLPWWVWLLPLAYVLWANIHIQFIHGLFLLALAAAAPIIDHLLGRPNVAFGPRWWLMIGLATACFLGTLANPYHARLYFVVVEYAVQPGPYEFVAELQALKFRSPGDWVFLAMFLGAWYSLGRVRVGTFEILLLAVAAWFSFRSCRDIWFGLLGSLLVLARLHWAEPEEGHPTPWACLLGAGLLAVLALGVGAMRGLTPVKLAADTEKLYPARVAQIIEERAYTGPLFNDFNWGGYLIWRLPAMPVIMDGRTNLHGDSRLRRIAAVFAGAPGWENDPDLSAAGVVVIPAESALASLMMFNTRFVLVHRDEVAFLFVARAQAGR